MTSIEELAFQLADQYSAGALDKLISLLELLLHGKKGLEARAVSEPAVEAKKAAPAKKAAATKAAKAEPVEPIEPTPDPSADEDGEEPF